MSNIKDLFNGKKSERVLENATQRSVGTSVESADYLKENVKQKQRFIPHVDFSSASNFAIYGSAEKYYEDSYNYILNEYPYDGSFKEKVNWSLSGTYLDRYIFESEYPRTTGYVNMGQSYGFDSQKTLGYDASTKDEWIYFKGNNTNSAQNTNINPNLSVQFDNLNVYNTASSGLYNVELEGSGGTSVEFWLRKPSFNSSNESRRQVVVDIWNSGTFGTAGYGRFRVEISGTDSNVVNPNFHIELLSGSAGFSSGVASGLSPTIVLSGSTLTGSWNHFALTFANTGSQMVGRLYTNGLLSYTHVAGTSMGTVTGSMLGQIGSLVSTVSGSGALKRGYAKLSASLDEFRFWKSRKTDKEISQYWFSQVGGGTNTDITLATSASTKYSYENPVDLGVYYKFNEGIINTSSINSQDALVLDYAGRVTNGRWEGYSLTSRNTGSAIMSASAASYEFEDPILYSSHPLVSASLDDKRNLGKLYDVENNSSMFGSLPRWITDDDENNSNSALKNLTQIMSSYFDTLYLQTQAVSSLKDKTYISGTNKPFPFSNRFIDSSGFLTTEIFTKASDLEYLDARNDKKLFTEKVDELKNLIYQNVYNNLIHVYKTKGTMKSFRNLIRCFGVDSELINVRLYGDQVTHKLLDNYDNAVVRKKYANFHTEYNMDAVVYQQTASSNSYSRGYISSSAEVQHRGNTYELETFFPPDYKQGTGYYFNSQFTTASLFGCHTSGAAGSTAWGAPDYGQFQVQTVRPDIRRSAAYFQLTCSNDGLGPFPQLTSSVFQDVYEGSRWNLAVRVKPKKYPFAAGVTGSSVGQYDLEFSGYNYILDILNNSFLVTASVSATNAQRFLKSNKRFFVGAHRTNTTGTILQKSNVKSTSLRVWMDYLPSGTLVAHAKDTTNFGTQNPYRDAYLNEESAVLGSKNVKAIPQLETLVMNWDFATVTGSDAAGNFTVQDVSIASSGSNDYSSRWGWLGPIGQYQHTGKGYGFLTNSTSSIDRRYVNTLIQQPPEVVNSSDMISLIDADRNRVFSKDSRPEQYFFAFEKSMYNIISKEIIDIFGTIVDFNNLIGQPVNRYRAEYKDMQKLRQLYFERVQNNVDLDKFVEYFKWLDSSLSVMLQQLVPGSARFSENLRTMVESHVLERNKYQSKFPTLEMKQSDPEAGVFGINEMLYSGKYGTAPIPTTATGSNCEWWLERANRNNTNITSGDASVNAQRNIVRLANDFRSGSGPTLAVSRNSTATTTTYEGQAYAIRNFTKIYRLDVDEQPVIHGGSNFAKNKTVEYTHEALKFGSSEYLVISASSIPSDKGCDDVIIPNSKLKLEAKVINTGDPFGYTSGKSDIFAPFSLYSSSVTTGYVADVATNFRSKTEINNYHDDIYGDDKGIPAQGPFTERHVGGRQHRHLNINTSSATTTLTRPEAWNLEFNSFIDAKSIVFETGSSPNTADRLRITSDDGLNSLPFGSGSFSMGVWFKSPSLDPVGYQKVLLARRSNFVAGYDFGLEMTNPGGTLQFVMRQNSGVYAYATSLVDYNDDAWHFAVIGWNGTDEIFLDMDGGDERRTTTATTRSGSAYGEVLTIGAYSSTTANRGWSGNLDEVSFWDKGLSAAECVALYNSGCPTDLQCSTTSTPGLVSWWRMGDDPNDSTDSSDAAARVYDVVGGYNATPVECEASDIVESTPVGCTRSISCSNLVLSPRTAHQPRATMIRDAYAKRPLNIANLKWGTSSAVAGNYRFGYQILQTSGRSLNNRFFIANGGFSPTSSDTGIFSGAIDYALPRFDLTGTNKSIFVERFNAPGGPEVSSRGCLDVNAEEFSVYNELNYRNLMVREALDSWLTEHCGQFGISPTGSVGDGTNPSQHMTNPMSYEGVVAAYHKVNRNPRETCLVKSGYDRQVNWLKLNGEITFDRTTAIISKPGGASTGWNAGAVGGEKIPRNGYLSFQVTTISDDQLIGLNSNPPAGASYGDMDYALHISATGPGNVYVYQNGNNPHISAGFAAVGNVFRILRENETVYYQKSTDSGKNFITFYTSLVKSTADLYPDITLYDAGAGVANVKISNPQYDNWFVQHNIPQSSLQYAWINNSYNSNLKQPLGYTYGCHDAGGVVPFSVPSGTTSMTQSTVQFLTQSLWKPYTTPFYVNFAQYSFFSPDRTFANYYRTQLTESNNTISPGSQFYTDGVIAPTINAYFNNVNGPYGYPSWKQLRAGETPVPRFHKRSNILSVGSNPGVITLPNGSGTNKPATYFDPQPDPNNITNYTEPPVTFKFRPLISELTNVQLQHSFGNNLCLWTQRGLPFNNPTQSIGEYLGGLNNKTDAQIYNKLIESDDYNTDFQSLTYAEVSYPRSANTGLGSTRSRTRYAETASVINVYSPSFPPTASLSIGHNGIDRGPNVRRTFWKKSYYERNRYLPQFAPAAASPGYPSFQTTISNSCGNYDGMARSVWPFGAEPIVYNPPSVNEAHEAVTVSSLSGASSFALNNGLDTGELNSINTARIGGMLGGLSGSIYPSSWLHELYINPSASAFYYWLPSIGDAILYSQAPNNTLWTKWGPWNATSAFYIQQILSSVNKGMKWRTNIDAGKDPWYDSYEAYAENIRGLSQTRTILPEFKISDNMEYYVNTAGNDFRAQNDKFLSLDGGNVTSSALTHTSPGNLRGFDENFFKEYSFSDFQKYFGTFAADYKLNKIAINCTAVKKLLPYKGFYPADRSTQLVSLFSGALGPHLGGGALSASNSDPEPTARVQSGSDQLAMQSLLQPFFAPGILYNTIKSGIAVDWGVFTGSTIAVEVDLYPGFEYNVRNPDTRFPFKSLLDPLQYVPHYQSDGTHRLLHNAPSYYVSQPNREPMRFPYAEFSPSHPEESVTDLYSSAMHNYLAEIPNFFLRNSELQAIESRPAGDIQVEAGKIYVMDAYIEKTNNAPNDELIMVQDYFNGYVSSSFPFFASSSYPTHTKNPLNPNTFGSEFLEIGTVWGPRGAGVTGSYNGKYFGPGWNANRGTYAASSSAWQAGYIPLRDGDPSYAPVTPPYFYGKAKVRLMFTASAEDAQTAGGGLGFRWAEVMNRMTMSFKSVDDPRRGAWTKFEEPNQTDEYRFGYSNFSYHSMMDVTASLNIKGILSPDPSNMSLDRWVISPYMETPVLDFSSSQAPEYGYGRGMWSGYGEVPQNHKGIFFGVERTPNLFIGTYSSSLPAGNGLVIPNQERFGDMTEWFRGASRSRQIVGATNAEEALSYSLQRKVGQLADSKMISEAIVAIPFSTRRVYANSGMSKTVHRPIMGKYFFSLGGSGKSASRDLFNNMKTNKLNTGFSIPGPGPQQVSELETWGVDAPVRDTSVSMLALNMEKYILPPELDFNKYSDIEPFVMYMIEFEHELDRDDLKDIWQGVMPKIAMTPELDSQGISHEMKNYEFFGGRPLPAQNEIRWMVFKIKKRAAINYWAATKDGTDDSQFIRTPAGLASVLNPRSNSFVNPLGYDYSYNWPYDNFSLVELAQVEVGNNFGRKPPPPPGPTTTVTPAHPLATEAAAGNVSAAPPLPPVTTAVPGAPGGSFTAANAAQRAANRAAASSQLQGASPAGRTTSTSRTTAPANRSPTGGGFSTE